MLQGPDRRRLTASVLATIELGAQRQEPPLLGVLESQEAAVRYWAAVGLGHIGGEAAVAPLTARLDDPSAAVRVAAAAALCQRGHTERALPLLAREVNHANLIVGLYAIRALEQIGPPAHPALPVVLAARESPYEFTRRVARRLTAKLEWYAEP